MKKSFEERIKEFVSTDPVKLQNSDVKLQKYYQKNIDTWVENANKFRLDYPEETGKFWAELLRSDFTLKFAYDSQKLVKANLKNWTNKEKVDFLRHTFESAYNQFGFLSLCINYDKHRIKQLREDWFIPESASTLGVNKKNTWKVKKKIVSGKKWIVKKSELFKLYSYDISLWFDLRQGDSHYKTIVSDSKIILLEEGKTKDISGRVDKLLGFIYDCTMVSMDFHTRLIFKHQFWLTPAIILTFPKEFNYRKKVVPFEILQDVLGSKEDKKSKVTFDDRIMKIFTLIAEYSLLHIWESIKNKRELMDKLLSPKGLKVDLGKINEIQETSFIDLLNLLLITKKKLNEFLLDKSIELKEVNSENMADFDFQQEFIELQKVALEGLKIKEREGKVTVFIFIITNLAYGMLIPISKLVNNFKSLFVEK